ncbi:MAG: RNA polymerase sigma factor [Granulosicoccus sp.]
MDDRASTLALLLQAAYRYAHTLTGNQDDAQDLVHEGWLRVVERHGSTPDKALLFRVIRNLQIDRYRHSQRFPSESFDEQRLVGLTVEEECALSAADDRLLAAGLARLRRVEREALFLSVIEGYTAEEIARLTDSTRGTVLSLIHRSRLKLRRWLLSDEGRDLKLVASNRGVRS